MDEIEITEEAKVLMREKQAELVKVIEAFAKLENSEEWGTLKELVFNNTVTSIERQILNKALASQIDVNELYKLQGEWVWAKQYADVSRFTENLKKQIENIKNKLK